MNNSGVFGIVFCAFILLGCTGKNDKKTAISQDILIEDFDFAKDAVFDTLNIPEHLKKTVIAISALNVYETGSLAKGQKDPPANFNNAEKLYQIASEQELFTLADNRNSAVAVYAAIGLLEKQPRYLESVFSKLLSRKQKVHVQNGCVISDDNPAEPVYWKRYYQLKPDELRSDLPLKKLDSMLLFSPDSSELILSTALRNRIYPDVLKKQIVNLAFSHHRMPAMLYLSTWYKKDYAVQLQKEYIEMLGNKTVDDTRKRKYLAELLSFNNPRNRKVILGYIKKDSLCRDEETILSRLEFNGITPEDY